jgi:hypothetical protein
MTPELPKCVLDVDCSTLKSSGTCDPVLAKATG